MDQKPIYHRLTSDWYHSQEVLKQAPLVTNMLKNTYLEWMHIDLHN